MNLSCGIVFLPLKINLIFIKLHRNVHFLQNRPFFFLRICGIELANKFQMQQSVESIDRHGQGEPNGWGIPNRSATKIDLAE